LTEQKTVLTQRREGAKEDAKTLKRPAREHVFFLCAFAPLRENFPAGFDEV
jgi:hypothetical protein